MLSVVVKHALWFYQFLEGGYWTLLPEGMGANVQSELDLVILGCKNRSMCHVVENNYV